MPPNKKNNRPFNSNQSRPTTPRPASPNGAKPGQSGPPIKPPSKDAIAVEGKIVDALPNAMFGVVLDNGHNVLGHISGKMRKNFIKILPGDRVVIELSPYDLTRGRITFRYK